MGFGRTGITPASIFSRPTADEIWLGPMQASALSQLTRCWPVQIISGARATGRSLLLRRLAQKLGGQPATTPLVLESSARTDRAVLGRLLQQLGMNAVELGTIDRRNLLTVLLEERLIRGERTVILVDDFDLQSDDAKEEIGRLARLTSGGGSRVELRLVVRACERADNLLPWLKASPPIVRLRALSEREVEAYIAWRFERMSLEPLFTDMACKLVRRFSNGTFRGVDTLCRMTLLLLDRSPFERADVRMVDEAACLLREVRSRPDRSVRNAVADPAADSLKPPRPGTNTVPIGTLTVTLDGVPQDSCELRNGVLIGSAPSNDICLPGATVSRYHALIQVTPESVELLDLNSGSGVSLNGRPVDDAVLHNYDVITVGEYKIKIRLTSDATVRDRKDTAHPAAGPELISAGTRGRHLRVVR